HIEVPALRERREDIPVLLNDFIEVYAAKERVPSPVILPETLAPLQAYSWPGNVRELRNLAERLVVRFSHGESITPDDLPAEIRRPRAEDRSAVDEAGSTRVAVLMDRMIRRGESFWSVVHTPFMAR